MTQTLVVRGHKIRSASRRRYIVVLLNGEHASVYKRSDSLATAADHVRRYGVQGGAYLVTVDSVTGEEV